ncbi:hypothetical protein RND71_004957 [Anisodus tanguticus]|uniref:Uncharacterized protein n=1 Tax=Anisodus tanguticus TaxID=243964 RepID=A0AAE1SQJ0_9SOLA|nr:hypothetical protein RND71_004957 [Anisodus tanguticus]
MFLFWLTSVIPQARPPPCVASNNICRSVEVFQLFFLCFSLAIIAIGAGAIKSSSLAFGSDQLKREAYQENACAMESYFSWYYAVFLNKACIVQDPQLDLSQDGEATEPWRLCTVDQVEGLKALFKVVPIWLTGAVMSINIRQNSFPVLQANTMDRHIGSSFEIPAGSFGIFVVISAILWIVLYDCLILPIASKMTGKPAHFSTKERMGFGLFLSFLSVLVTAVVEVVRRSIAIKEGYSNDPQGVIHMSAMWQLPQNSLTGFAEALHAIG